MEIKTTKEILAEGENQRWIKIEDVESENKIVRTHMFNELKSWMENNPKVDDETLNKFNLELERIFKTYRLSGLK